MLEESRHYLHAFVLRVLLLFGFWLLLLEPDFLSLADTGLDWAVGALAAMAGARLSLRLLPPASRALRPWPLLRFMLRYLGQSLVGGADVARRALDPRLPVDPGLLRQPTALPGGMSRALFSAVTSQVPGTLAVGSDDDEYLRYHCLDQGQDVAGGLARDEALFLQILGEAGETDRQPRK